MSNTSYGNKKTIFCVYGIIVLWLMAAHAVALGQTETKASKEIEPEVLERQFIEELLGAANREELEQEDGHVLSPQILGTHAVVFPPDPDNAALLYYQAFLLRPQPDADTEELIYKVLRGAEPDEKVRKYLKSCRKTIKLTEAAAQTPECNWGILYSQGFGFNSEQLRHFRILLSLDARTLTADGHYREALGRCLTIRRLARHVHRFYSRSVEVDRTAFLSIRHILGSMPPDTDTLIWLQGQLTTIPGAPLSCAEMLKIDFEFMLGLVRKEHDTLARAREHLAEKAADDSARKEIQALSDEELLVRARQSYERFLNSVLRIIGSSMPYEKTYTEIQRLKEKLEEQAYSDPVIILWPCLSVVGRFYGLQVWHTAEFNALKGAIEVYLALAKTGHLPKKLPEHLPKDPFTDKDFVYEITDEGFALRCQGKTFQGRGKQVLEFKVRK